MHVPPAHRRWGGRVGLAVIVATAIGYLPSQVLRRDPRTAKLDVQLAELAAEARSLTAHNEALMRDIEALRSDVSAVEARARLDLGMVYPDEIVLHMPAPPVAPPPLTAPGGAPVRAPVGDTP